MHHLIVNNGLKWDKARLKCFSSLVFAVIKNRLINLTLLATTMTNATTQGSEYRKAQRFFEKFAMPLHDLGVLIASQIPKEKRGWTLSIDRTNWKFGKTHINILVVGIVMKNVAIPIVWRVLPQKTKRGNSNTKQRIEIMERVLQIVPAKLIYALTMDREFIGAKWLNWLETHHVGFIVRIKKNQLINGIPAHRYHSSRSLKNKGRVDVFGMKLYFAGKSIYQGRSSHLYVISNLYEGRAALRIYKQRWAIERLFSHMKKRGFNLEDTHIRSAEKLERLFGVIAVSFLLTFGWGLMIQLSKRLTAYEKRKSTFRLGLESLLELFNTKKTSLAPPPPRISGSTLLQEEANNLFRVCPRIQK